MTEPLKPPDDGAEPGEFRWQAIFRRCRDPVFLLDAHGRILFANPAWQSLTGIPLSTARVLVCQRYRSPEPGSREAVLSALCLPAEVLKGQPAFARRVVAGAGGRTQYWDISFVPFAEKEGILGTLGRVWIRPADPEPASVPPLPPRLLALRERLAQWHHPDHLASELPALRRVLEQVRLARQSPVPVLILGEPGAGKQWLARTIHQQSSPPEQTFAALACRLPPALLEALLFGERGLAHRPGVGAVYLQEPQHLPRELQARLCEMLQTAASSAPRRPRLMAGCGTDPQAELRAGRLLEELHCALGVLTIALPPLRERLADLPALVERLLQRVGGPALGKALTPEAWEVLRAWSWPGNLRELFTVLQGAAGRARGESIEVGDLPWYLRNVQAVPARSLPLKPLLEKVERRLIELALTLSRGSKTKAAELLDVWRPSLLAKMERLGIEVEPERPKQPHSDGPDAGES